MKKLSVFLIVVILGIAIFSRAKKKSFTIMWP